MFSRIFSNQKREEKKEISCEWRENLDDFQAAPRLPKCGKSNIRVLIFRECDRKGKSLLFDSDAVVEAKEEQVSFENEQKNVNTSRNSYMTSTPTRGQIPKYKCLKPKSDINMLGEMMFGSVTMTHRGSIVRVHYIRTPPQLLLSKVFAVRSRSSGNGVSEGNSSTSFGQSESLSCQPRSFSSGNISIPLMCSSPNRSLPGSAYNRSVSTPSLAMFGNTFNCSMTSIDSLNISGLNISGGNLSSYSPLPSPGCSFNRRLQRSQMTRLDNYQHSKLKSDTGDDVQAVYRRQPKIGIGVVFKLWESHEERNRVFQNFVFSHYTIYERHLQYLRIMIEKAFHSKKNFIVSAVEAVENFKERILSFYSAPRLLEPVWLNMMNIRDKQEEIAERFITILLKSMSVFENKDNNYFLSSLLTAVLMHHLAWVPTVMPAGSTPMRAYLDKHSSKTLDVLAKCHPYNPLWAQLGDLYGTLGYPPKLTKTIVVGKDPSLVRQILYILSYFIRCSDVGEYSISVDMDRDYDDYSIGTDDKLSIYSKTPTNTPVIDSWNDNMNERILSEKITDQDDKAIKRTVDNAIFDDAEEVCDCMCSVLKTIDYIGGKNLRNLKKNKKKDFHVDFAKDLKKSNNIESMISDKENSTHKATGDDVNNKNDYSLYMPKAPSFRCYCCPDKVKGRLDILEMRQNKHEAREVSETGHHFKRDSFDSTDISHPDIGSKSCCCVSQDSSEYGSETVSNCQSTLSRQSSCASCLEFFRRSEMQSQDLDSDYSSFTNEEEVASQPEEEVASQLEDKGIELNFHDVIDEDCKIGDIEVDEEMKSMNLMEIHLPESEIKAVPQRHFDHKVELPNFGRSLLAGYCDSFVGDFALHGVKSVDMKKIESDLRLSLKHAAVDEAVYDAAYIIADVDKRKCKLVTLSRNQESMMLLPSDEVVKTDIFGSSLVSELLDSLKGLWNLNIPYQFCLMHLEDRLNEIFNKSEVLAEYVKNQKSVLSKSQIGDKMGFQETDLELLIAAASTHSPFVPQMIV